MKRPVKPLALMDMKPGLPPTAKPGVTWIAPGKLLIDAAYQRDLSDASLKLIRRIVEGWDWRRFKPPIAAWTDEGLEVIDGQHSAIAAATHPGIDQIPVVVVEAVAQQDRAGAFIGHNRDRLGVTAVQMHIAAVAAGDEEALRVNRVCEAAEIEVLRVPPSRGVYKPRTTIAVAVIRTLLASVSEADATWVLRALADAEVAPVSAMHIRALHHLITTEEFAEVDRDAMARGVRAAPIKAAEKEAQEHAAVHRVPSWRGLAAVWFKAARKGHRAAPRTARAAPPGTVAIPPWVPDHLVDEFCTVAAMKGEEAAATHVRRLKSASA